MHTITRGVPGDRVDRDAIHVPAGLAIQRPGSQALPLEGGHAGEPGIPLGDSALIRMKLMSRLTYILPTFCLVFSLASIFMMYVRISRIKVEYAAARKEASQL